MAAGCAAAFGGLAGCGGDGREAISPDERAVEEVLRSAVAEVARGDGRSACARLTARARAQAVREAGGRLGGETPRTCEEAVQRTAAELPAGAAAVVAAIVVSEVKVDGSRASAVVAAPGDLRELAEASGRTASARVRLVRASGAWRVDGAEPLR